MPVAPLATVVRDRGRTLGSIRPPRQILDTIQGSSSPPRKIPGSIPDIPAGFGARSCSPGRDQDNDGERGSRNSFRPRPWFLQLPVPSRKVFGRLETRNRPLTPERVRSSNTIQDENTQPGSSCGQERRLPHLDRPQGRLLPDSSSPLPQKAPPFRLKRYGLPVQSSVFRVIDRPASVHKSFRGGLVLGSLSRSPPATIPGRLADPVLLGGQDKATGESTPRTLPLPRHSYKQEVRPLPIQVRRIPRHDHRHGISPSVPHRDSNPEIPLLSKEVLIPTEPPGPAVAGVVGTHVIAGEAGSPHKTPDAFTPMASEVQLVHRERSPTPSGTPVPAGGQGHLLVDGEGPPPRGDALRGKKKKKKKKKKAPELRLYSDASRSGWGAHLLDQSASGLWSYQETSLHINILEMKALFLALLAFQDTTTDQRVTAMCDNSSVVAYVSKQGGTVSDSLCELTGQLLRWTEADKVLLEARYLPGQSNVLADLLSRRNQVLGTEWSLLPQVAKKIICTWGSPTIDLFATHLNVKLPLYCSLIPDPQAVFEDAFRHPWNHLNVYAFPPFHLVERVVARVRETPNLSMTLIAPLWPEKSWFADLLLLLTQPPLALPPWDRLLRQPHFHRFHGGVHALNLHAWRLSSVSSESQDCRDKLHASCPDVSESPLHACTSCNGSLSVVGVVERALLRSTPLYP